MHMPAVGVAEPAAIALRRRHAELHTVLRHVAVTIVVFDRTGTITSFEAFGSAREGTDPGCVGRTVVTEFADVAGVDDALLHVLAGGETAFQLERHGRVWDVRIGPVAGPDGEVQAGVAVAMDVTQTVREARRLEESERRFRVLTEGSTDLALMADPDGTLTFVSAASRAMLGYEPDDVVGNNGFASVHRDDRARVLAAYGRAVEGESGAPPIEFRLLHADGSWRWFEQTYINLLDDPVMRCMASNLRDITARKVSEAALVASEERSRTIVESAQEGIWMVDADFTTTFANARMAELLRVEPAELLGRPIFDFFFPRHHDQVVGSLLERHREQRRSDEVPYRRADGEVLWAQVVSSQVFGDDGELRGFVGLVTDITERRADARRMERWALHDDLTDLPTRRGFDVELSRRAAAQSAGAGDGAEACAVLMVGIDDMKDLNGTLGHDGGDQVLREVGRRLRDELGAVAVARSSGDEFLALVAVEEGSSVLDAAGRVRRVLAPLIHVDHDEVALSVCIGIASSDGSAGGGQLLDDAESALHEAKRGGKGHLVVFDDELRRAAADRVATEAGLRRAIDAGQLEVHYQPVHDLATGALAGCEALVRWRHPERGLLQPGSFIPVAERSDLIVDIGEVVLAEACRQRARWAAVLPDDDRFTVSVNIAARHLAAPDLVETVRAAVASSGIAASTLCLEITESAVMEHTERAAQVLRELRELGVRVAIDDFGTGHSSLGYLRSFAVDVLKIDRAFVAGIGDRPEDRALVDAIVGLARTFGFRVVAEGVETDEQRRHLTEAGCDAAQGYLWSPPVVPEAFAERFLGAVALSR